MLLQTPIWIEEFPDGKRKLITWIMYWWYVWWVYTGLMRCGAWKLNILVYGYVVTLSTVFNWALYLTWRWQLRRCIVNLIKTLASYRHLHETDWVVNIFHSFCKSHNSRHSRGGSTIDRGMEPHQYLLAGTWKRMARPAMLATKILTGVVPEVNDRETCSTYTSAKCKYGCPLWNSEEMSSEVQNRGVSGPTKKLMCHLLKKSKQILSINWTQHSPRESFFFLSNAATDARFLSKKSLRHIVSW